MCRGGGEECCDVSVQGTMMSSCVRRVTVEWSACGLTSGSCGLLAPRTGPRNKSLCLSMVSMALIGFDPSFVALNVIFDRFYLFDEGFLVSPCLPFLCSACAGALHERCLDIYIY